MEKRKVLEEPTAKDFEINRWLQKLDEKAVEVRAKWGEGNLESLVSSELALKWDTQKRKLNAAIQAGSVEEVTQLVDGTIRGYDLLEKEALANGHKPNNPETWDFIHPESKRKYRIVKTLTDARSASEEGVCTYTLDEVARILESKQLVAQVKEIFPDSNIEKVSQKDFDWKEGDDIPFF